MTTKIIDTFEKIAKPFNKGFGEKEQTFVDIIKEELPDAKFQYVEGQGLIVYEEEPFQKVFVSHLDLVYPFMKGFADGKTHTLTEDRMYGGLDNTITNACLLLAMIELRKSGKAKNVRFLFTEGEESGLTGMRNYMVLTEGSRDVFYVNLDVTNDNWESNASIEFDKPNRSICHQIFKNIPDVGFTTYRFTDDNSAILGCGGQGLSYCIPTEEYCHTYNSNLLIKTLEPYYNGLIYLIDELDVTDMEHDIFDRLNHKDFLEKVFNE